MRETKTSFFGTNMIRKKKTRSKKRTTKSEKQIISLRDGWNRIYKVSVEPFIGRVELGLDADRYVTGITQQTSVMAYDTVFEMCIQKEPYNYSPQLYDLHNKTIVKYFKNVALTKLYKERTKSSFAYLQEWINS